MKMLITLLLLASVVIAAPSFPLQLGPNNRHFVDSEGEPFLYNADTCWLLFHRATKEEAVKFMKVRKNQGFNVIQVSMLPFAPIDSANAYGDLPFTDFDLNQPNDDFFNHAAWVIEQARELDLLIVAAAIWKGCCGEGYADVLSENGGEKSRQYGRFLGERFKQFDNLFWIMGGDNDPRQHIDHYRQIALGIKEANPDQLITYHAASTHSSSDVIPHMTNTWLNFSFTYTYFPGKRNWVTIFGFGQVPHIYEVNRWEFWERPVRPYVLGEAQYEGLNYENDNSVADAAVVRRQAYWAMLSGACGHAYGSWNWRMKDNWQDIKKDNGANDMSILRREFEALSWHRLMPDYKNSVIVDGYGTFGKSDYVTTAALSNGSLSVSYIPPTGTESRDITVDLAWFVDPIKLDWINPATGEKQPAVEQTLSKSVRYVLSTPGDNGDGANDWLLIIQHKKQELPDIQNP